MKEHFAIQFRHRHLLVSQDLKFPDLQCSYVLECALGGRLSNWGKIPAILECIPQSVTFCSPGMGRVFLWWTALLPSSKKNRPGNGQLKVSLEEL